MIIVQHYIISIAILSLFIFFNKCACAFFFRLSVVSNESQCRLPIITITFSKFWPMYFAFKLYHDGSRMLSLKSRFNLDMMLQLRLQLLLAPCTYALTRHRDSNLVVARWGSVKKNEKKNVCSLFGSTTFQTSLNVRPSFALSMISISTYIFVLILSRRISFPTKSEARMCS